jgi:hypothetical protein
MYLSRLILVLLAILGTTYIAVASFIFVPYYNWQYARTHGYMEWLLFGELTPTLKAYSWPVDVFSWMRTPTSHEKTSASHEIAAIDYHNKSVEIAKKYGG